MLFMQKLCVPSCHDEIQSRSEFAENASHPDREEASTQALQTPPARLWRQTALGRGPIGKESKLLRRTFQVGQSNCFVRCVRGEGSDHSARTGIGSLWLIWQTKQ